MVNFSPWSVILLVLLVLALPYLAAIVILWRLEREFNEQDRNRTSNRRRTPEDAGVETEKETKEH